ncbi:hypothetical protein RvY_02499 [Ramazzottius varieornatus]|uniref:Uncharacterized protein n=1 Tax=Ramazzottius varieornatus TaxID=947166 RepID=A0A1D1UV22_RAMVA|nr:hypothetical protein RvY_02499 [Ramazzottius varieornatus]
MELLAGVMLLFLATAVDGSGRGSGWNLEADRRNRILKDTWTKDFNPHKTLDVRPNAGFSTVKKAYLSLRQQSSSRPQPWKADHAYAMFTEQHIEENHITQAERQSMSMNEAIDDLPKSWIFLGVCLVVAALLIIIIRQHFAPEEPLTVSTFFLDVTADLSKSELDDAFTEEATLSTPCLVNTPPAQRLFPPMN